MAVYSLWCESWCSVPSCSRCVATEQCCWVCGSVFFPCGVSWCSVPSCSRCSYWTVLLGVWQCIISLWYESWHGLQFPGVYTYKIIVSVQWYLVYGSIFPVMYVSIGIHYSVSSSSRWVDYLYCSKWTMCVVGPVDLCWQQLAWVNNCFHVHTYTVV